MSEIVTNVDNFLPAAYAGLIAMTSILLFYALWRWRLRGLVDEKRS